MKIIFLDIDGVLNRHEKWPNKVYKLEPDCLGQLNQLLAAAPDAKIVITSTWRELMAEGFLTPEGFEFLLMTHGVNCKGLVKGGTTMAGGLYQRTKQIDQWMQAHGFDISTDKYVIIDDMKDIFTSKFIGQKLVNLVLCDPGTGLTATQVEKAIRFLA